MTVLEGDIDALESNGAKTEPANRMTASPRISTLLPARKITRMRLRMKPWREPAGPAHSHSIINGSRKSAWLKGLAVIDMGLYRRFYRQENMPFAGAGLRGIGSSSIGF